MSFLSEIQGVDILLIDQILKGRIGKEDLVLDAGCGRGRNSLPLLMQGFNVTAFDPESRCASFFSNYPEAFINSSISDFISINKFDFIICNAVLHFAKSHLEFDDMISRLIQLMPYNGGVLFIRMTSDLAFKAEMNINNDGICLLPDGSLRYLLTQSKLDEILVKFNLKLKDPVKTVNVQNLRCMTTLVLER